jgi:hypothetical protein
MTHPSSAQELEIILSVVTEHPDGISMAALEEAIFSRLPLPMNRRTLLRRLGRLIKNQKIVSTGKSVACLYQPAALPPPAAAPANMAPPPENVATESDIPVSAEGAAIRDQMRQALMHRRPVGYQRSFLEDYNPGVTWYLPESMRAQLHEIGRTPAGARPAGTYARDILSRLLVDLSWASSRLEGNTYSRLDTQNLIEFGRVAEGKEAQETQMVLNHKAAIEMLVDSAEEIGFDSFTFQNLHAVLSQNLLRDDTASGRLRRRPVEISGTVFYPLAMPQVIEDCFRLLLDKAAKIPDPFEQAFFLMVQLPYLQPFEDVNKRVARIGANIPLFKNNLCPLSFVDVPERDYVEGILGVYELNRVALLRDVFVWAYERSCQRYLAITQTMAEPDPLKIQYHGALIEAVQRVVKELLAPAEAVIQQISSETVPQNDQAAFALLLAEAIEHLHEGRLARYRLRRSEFVAWQNLYFP